MDKKLTKTETHYHAYIVKTGDNYEDFDVVESGGRIKVKIYDERWRTVEDSITLFENAIRALKEFKITP